MLHCGSSTRRGLMAALSLSLLLGPGCAERDEPDGSSLSLVATLGGADTTGYERAVEPRTFVFPDDHGPHPGFRTEWWYVTGNLSAASGRELGFQLTLFRSALSPAPRLSTSAWATNQAYMGHLAVTDPRSRAFHAFERFARGAGGLAGARSGPFRVWLEDWVLESEPGQGGDGEAGFPLRLRAGEGDVALDLRLAPGKPAVLQGDAGLSQKGAEAGNASYYYSHTRLPTTGTVVLGGDTVTVSGLAWLDREWSTSALSDGQVGWDWFALQMDDGWDLMIYALRMADGTAHARSEGVLVDPQGGHRRLRWGEDVRVEVTDTWASPREGTEYPSRWRVTVPARDWDLEVIPLIPDQELDLTFRYWEGAVRAQRTGGGAAVGRGYVELTGYADSPDPRAMSEGSPHPREPGP